MQHWDFPMVQWLRLRTHNAGGPGSIPGQGMRANTPQLKVRMLQLKILHYAMKIKDPTCHS